MSVRARVLLISLPRTSSPCIRALLLRSARRASHTLAHSQVLIHIYIDVYPSIYLSIYLYVYIFERSVTYTKLWLKTMGIVQSRSNESDAGVREVFHGSIKDGSSQHSYQPSHGIGALAGLHTKSGSVRGAPRQPMPDAVELERRFTKVLASMDLPPDKAKLLKQYDNEKKMGHHMRSGKGAGERSAVALLGKITHIFGSESVTKSSKKKNGWGINVDPSTSGFGNLLADESHRMGKGIPGRRKSRIGRSDRLP